MSDDYAHRDDPALDREEAKIIRDSYPGVSMSDHTVGKIEQLTHAHAPTGDGRKELGEALIDGLVKSLAEAGADSSYQVETGAAPAPTSDEGTPTHLLTDERTGQVGVDAGLLKKVGRDMYEVVGNAPAPTGDAYEDVDGWAKPGCTVAPAPADVDLESAITTIVRGEREIYHFEGEPIEDDFRDLLKGVLTPLVSAAEARVRAEVWGKAHEAVDKSSARVTEMVRTGNVLTVSFDQLPDAQVLVFVDAEAIEKAALADGADLTSLAKPE